MNIYRKSIKVVFFFYFSVFFAITIFPHSVYAGTFIDPTSDSFRNFEVSQNNAIGYVADIQINYTFWREENNRRWYQTTQPIRTPIGVHQREGYYSTLSIPSQFPQGRGQGPEGNATVMGTVNLFGIENGRVVEDAIWAFGDVNMRYHSTATVRHAIANGVAYLIDTDAGTESRTTGEIVSNLNINVSSPSGHSDTIPIMEDGTFSISRLACNDTYTLSVYEDQTSIRNKLFAGHPLVALISGAERAWVEGQTTFAVNENCEVSPSPVELEIEKHTEGVFEAALRQAIDAMMRFVFFALDTVGGIVNNLLMVGNEIEGADGIETIWQNVRNLALSLLTLVLLMVAFANILSINLEQFGLVKMIPRIIIAIVLVYFSMLIAAFLLDLASALQALLLGEIGANRIDLRAHSGNLSTMNPGDTAGMIPEAIFLLALGLAILLGSVFILLVLVVRNAMLFFLVAVSPLAFMANILPFTEKYYKQWWASFWKWMFIGPAVIFMLYLASSFLLAYEEAKLVGDEEARTLMSWLWLIATAVMVWLAATLPLKMGGEIYGQIQKTGSWAGKKTGASQYLAARKADKESRIARRAERARLGLASSRFGKMFPTFAGSMTGVKGDEEREAAEEKLKGVYKQKYARKNKDDLNNLIEEGKVKGLEREAVLEHLAETGQGDMDKVNVAKAFAKKSIEDGAFLQKVKDKMPDSFAKITTMALDPNNGLTLTASELGKMRGEAEKSITGKGAHELKGSQIEYAAKHNPEFAMSLIGSAEQQKNVLEKGGLGNQAAWGEAIKHLGLHSPDDVKQANFENLVGKANLSEERSRELAGLPINQGGKNNPNQGKNAWGEENRQRGYSPGVGPQGPTRPIA